MKKFLALLISAASVFTLSISPIAAAIPELDGETGTENAAAPRISQNYNYNVTPGWQFVTSDNNWLDQTVSVGVTDFRTIGEVEVKLVSNKGSTTKVLSEGQSTNFFNYWDAGTWSLYIRSTDGKVGWCHIWIQD